MLIGCRSAVIHRVLQNKLPGSPVMFFFFDVRDEKKTVVHGCLRSLIMQLSSHHDNFKQSKFYLWYKGVSAFEPENQLLQILCEMLQERKQAFIVLDGLDECTQWSELLHCIETLRSKCRQTNLHILLSSRRNVDIEQGLKPLVTAKMSIDEIYSSLAIQKFVDKQLEEDPRLRVLPSDLRAAIRKRLADGSYGMWVISLTSLNIAEYMIGFDG